MTAAPLNNSLAKVRKLLPVKIVEVRQKLLIMDTAGNVFCWVPNGKDNITAQARAELIRDAMNEME